MGKIRNILLLLGLSLMLVACSNQSASESFEFEALQDLERQDQIVTIPEETEFLTMDEQAKETIYESLDAIGTSSEAETVPEDYSHIEEINSEQEYVDLLVASQDQAVIIYLGFDECPWCKAFSPKLNQLASEYDLPIYYYNTRAREQDVTFTSSMETYGVDTVPYAFIVDSNKAQERINHHSSMEQIEEFLTIYVNNYLNQE